MSGLRQCLVLNFFIFEFFLLFELVFVVENKIVLFGSKFWIPEQFRTLTIAVLGPIVTETRRHPFSIPGSPFIPNQVSLAACFDCCMDCSFVCNSFFLYATDASFPRSPACHSFASMCSLASHLIVVWNLDFCFICMQLLYFVCNSFL